jgi:hypothetical protein
MLHRYPRLMLHLAPCSRELVRDVFMEFERPTPQAGPGKPPKGQYATIGEFYRAASKGLTGLDTQLGPRLWANNKPTVQYVSAYWNNDGGGEPLLVENLATALDALHIIMEQGEGIDPGATSVPIDPLKPGTKNKRYYYERTFISAMQGILVSVAEVMVATPVTKGPYGGKGNAGPTFEYYQLPRIAGSSPRCPTSDLTDVLAPCGGWG